MFWRPNNQTRPILKFTTATRDSISNSFRTHFNQNLFRTAKCNVGCRENPNFWVVGAVCQSVWHIQPYSHVHGPYSVMQSGASPGSSVGNANDWILFLWSIAVVLCLCFRSATSHSVQNTPKHRFLTQNTTTKSQKYIFYYPHLFCSMIRGIAKWHVFIPNGAFLVAKSALEPHGANPPHIHISQSVSFTQPVCKLVMSRKSFLTSQDTALVAVVAALKARLEQCFPCLWNRHGACTHIQCMFKSEW